MRKILLYLTLCFLITVSIACHVGTKDVTKYFSTNTGFIYMATLIEMNSNFSSLLYDKTRVVKVGEYTSKYDNISSTSNIFVLPVKIETPNDFHYDDSMQLVLKNYIKANKLGNITENANAANFHLVTKVKESFQNSYGKNTSYIEITLVDANNRPYFFTNVKMASKSDKNFFYFPRKEAKPVTYLTIKGFEYILKETLFKAFEEEKNA